MIKKIFLFLIPFLFVTCIVLAENPLRQKMEAALKGKRFVSNKLGQKEPYHSGLIPPSQEQYQKIDTAKLIRSFAKPEDIPYHLLPAAVDLSTDFPQAGNQGEQNSCTGWTTAYAIKSLLENRKRGWGLSPDHLFSPSFVYNQINDGLDEGAELIRAIELVTTQGVAPLTQMPYKVDDYKAQPSPELKRVARHFKVLGYRRIDEKNNQQIKSFLATGEPVVIVMGITENFLGEGMKKSGGLYKEMVGDFLGFHAMVVVGYDTHQKTIKVLNSWGSEWANKGLGLIDEDLFNQLVIQAYVLYDTPVLLADKNQVTCPPHCAPASLSTTEPLDPLLVVPHEAGLTYKNYWLRLGQSLKEAKSFFSETTAPAFKEYDFNVDDVILIADYLDKEKIGGFFILNQKRLPVATNDGVALTSTQTDVYRIYGRPDYVNPQEGSDTYFLHATQTNWGGLPVTRHATLTFYYKPDKTLSKFSLINAQKESITGKALQDVSSGTTLDDPHISLNWPSGFSKIQKSEWPQIGHGYFASDPETGSMIAVKIFFMGETVTEALMASRLDADKARLPAGVQITQQKINDTTWHVASSGTERTHYYTAKDKRIFQVEFVIIDSQSKESIIQKVMASFKIKQ